MSIPESIRRHKPTGYGAVEIHACKDKYYVYMISSRWDPSIGKARKVTGGCIGKITENDGFVPNARAAMMAAPRNPIVRNYGAYEIAGQLSGDLEGRLRQYFPDIFRELSVVARLRLIEGSTGRRIGDDFERSYLPQLHPDLKVSDYTVRRLLSKLSERRDRMEGFMRSYVKPGSKLLFDGTSIFARADDSACRTGYNPNHSLNPQVRLVYIFDRTSFLPVFYRMVPGNIVDRSTLKETIVSSGCSDCIVIADKGFYSKVNLSFLMQENLRFILPLQSNTALIDEAFAKDPDDRKFDGRFVFKDRLIWFRKQPTGDRGNHLYLFRDDQRKSAAEVRFQSELDSNWGEEGVSETDFFADTRRGLYAFVSNIDERPFDIYMKYKERWDIEQCFDFLKNSVRIGASHRRTNEDLEAWSFVNHISLLYFYGIVRALRERGLSKRYTAADIIAMGRNIYRVNTDNSFRVSEIPKNDQAVLDSLGVDLFRKN